MRRVRRAAGRRPGEPLEEDDWAAVLAMHGTRSGRLIERIWKALPATTRCFMCGAPFSRPGNVVAGPLGYRPSKMNPNLCSTCFEGSPPGGATGTMGVLFADLRGFTTMSADMAPREVSALLARFYKAAHRSLFPEAIIDKLIGDEVMALYLPWLVDSIHGPGSTPKVMLDHAQSLLAAMGYGSSDGPIAHVGIGLDYGEAYFGNVGDTELHDLTAVGDVVNTAARLQGHAASGEIILSARVAVHLESVPGSPVALSLKGKTEPQPAHRVRI